LHFYWVEMVKFIPRTQQTGRSTRSYDTSESPYTFVEFKSWTTTAACIWVHMASTCPTNVRTSHRKNLLLDQRQRANRPLKFAIAICTTQLKNLLPVSSAVGRWSYICSSIYFQSDTNLIELYSYNSGVKLLSDLHIKGWPYSACTSTILTTDVKLVLGTMCINFFARIFLFLDTSIINFSSQFVNWLHLNVIWHKWFHECFITAMGFRFGGGQVLEGPWRKFEHHPP
jgi:hypothetical protein